MLSSLQLAYRTACSTGHPQQPPSLRWALKLFPDNLSRHHVQWQGVNCLCKHRYLPLWKEVLAELLAIIDMSRFELLSNLQRKVWKACTVPQSLLELTCSNPAKAHPGVHWNTVRNVPYENNLIIWSLILSLSQATPRNKAWCNAFKVALLDATQDSSLQDDLVTQSTGIIKYHLEAKLANTLPMPRTCHVCRFTHGFWVTPVMGLGMICKYGTHVHTVTCSHSVQFGIKGFFVFFFLVASVPLQVCAKFSIEFSCILLLASQIVTL